MIILFLIAILGRSFNKCKILGIRRDFNVFKLNYKKIYNYLFTMHLCNIMFCEKNSELRTITKNYEKIIELRKKCNNINTKNKEKSNMINPFDITFGKPPTEIIDRPDLENEIIGSFLNSNRPSPIYILTGPKGCGKTVSLTSISNKFKDMDEWIVIDLNPQEDLESQFASMLYQKGKVKHLFLTKEFNFSFKGFGFSVSEGNIKMSSIHGILERMLEHIKKKGIKILLTVDEVSNNNHMRVFAHSYQSYLRNNYDVSLLMTGLYENVSSLQNEEGLTFLWRAPKIYLSPLNIRAMTYSYMNILGMSEIDAKEAATITNGYAFAYQLLGYILFNEGLKKVDDNALQRLDMLLDERAYSKIYSELSKKEKEIVLAVASGKVSNSEIKDLLNMKDGTLSTYKMILSKKGILDISKRGEVEFLLPRFSEFIRFHEM